MNTITEDEMLEVVAYLKNEDLSRFLQSLVYFPSTSFLSHLSMERLLPITTSVDIFISNLGKSEKKLILQAVKENNQEYLKRVIQNDRNMIDNEAIVEGTYLYGGDFLLDIYSYWLSAKEYEYIKRLADKDETLLEENKIQDHHLIFEILYVLSAYFYPSYYWKWFNEPVYYEREDVELQTLFAIIRRDEMFLSDMESHDSDLVRDWLARVGSYTLIIIFVVEKDIDRREFIPITAKYNRLGVMKQLLNDIVECVLYDSIQATTSSEIKDFIQDIYNLLK